MTRSVTWAAIWQACLRESGAHTPGRTETCWGLWQWFPHEKQQQESELEQWQSAVRRNKHATHSKVESTGPTTNRSGAGGQWEESSLNPKFPIWATEQVAWQPTPVFLPGESAWTAVSGEL